MANEPNKDKPMATLSVQIDAIAGIKKTTVPEKDVQKYKARVFREGFTETQNNGKRIRTYSPFKIACIDEVK